MKRDKEQIRKGDVPPTTKLFSSLGSAAGFRLMGFAFFTEAAFNGFDSLHDESPFKPLTQENAVGGPLLGKVLAVSELE